jgi:hypothetical protein
MSNMHKLETSEIPKVLDQAPCKTLKVVSGLAAAFSTPMQRRQLLGTAGTVAAGAAAATLLNAPVARAATLTDYFNILATGEALFVTLYSLAVEHQYSLGIYGEALTALQAILVEEQIHYNYALSQGGTPATTQFSFPNGKDTFKHRGLFLQTQQLAEELTNGALLAWINDMATMGQPRLAQIGGELMQVEGGHRVVGRVIMDADPWDNWAFGPVSTQLTSFLDVPNVVAAAGFLSPVPGNEFQLPPVPASPTFPGVINTTP